MDCCIIGTDIIIIIVNVAVGRVEFVKSNRLLDWLSKLFKVIIKRCQLTDLFWREGNLLKKIW